MRGHEEVSRGDHSMVKIGDSGLAYSCGVMMYKSIGLLGY